MKSIAVILPHLNEEFTTTKKLLLTISIYLQELSFPSEIIVADGGSTLGLINKIISLCKSLNRTQKVNFKCTLNFPHVIPNKNVGIMNALSNTNFEDILIIDTDGMNINKDVLKKLIHKLNKYDLVIPDLQRSGGRSNRLLGNPFLRLFFPDINKKVPYPYAGILGIKRNLLKKIIKEDYCFDWGGETQIVINGFLFSNGNVGSFIMEKKDTKSRPLSSKIQDAFQIYRTNILLSIINKRFPLKSSQMKRMLEEDIKRNKEEVNNLVDYLNFKKISYKKFNSIDDIYNYFDIPTGRNIIYLKNRLINLALTKKFYELYVIESLVVRPLISILFNTKMDNNFNECPLKSIPYLEIKRISFLTDILITLAISFYLRENFIPYTNLDSMLKNTNKNYEEFNKLSRDKYTNYFKNGINLMKLSKRKLSLIYSLLSIKNVDKRNNLLLKCMKII